ncbi:4-hydroxy-3-methylbut-2-enyl diphosphate reductase [Candidatus Aminicenantes bacterium AH-873-B07]|jgi:4-hydroxy-3-methylbut-2-enyl diphosphate reductase|nr:4-hydroxy-3-methylbut-2-enyl diphosphate reductase [Candidatus Aminicenantes bacterium AH-873-B07]
MRIRIANHSGFCFGVKRAIKIVRKIRKERKGKVLTFGDLIHNKKVVEELKKEGIDSVSDIAKINEGTVIIRSHGVSPIILGELRKKHIEIIDATCPFVKRIQKLAEKLVQEGYELVIVGDPKHPEIKALIGFTRGKEIIVNSVQKIQTLNRKSKRAVIAQSTQDINFFKEIVSNLIDKTNELRVFNTICDSTKIRQKSTFELASQVDIMFIVGDRKSSNTNKLFNIAKKIQSKTYFIEKVEDIKPEMINFCEEIGISAGASTPQELINEVVNKIKKIKSNSCFKERELQWMN